MKFLCHLILLFVDTEKGKIYIHNRKIEDSHRGGYGKISVAKALEVSSNIGFATIIDEHYSKQPEKFIKRIKSWHLNKPLGVAIIGEGIPDIPEPGSKKWSKNALPSMAYGYNLSLTPLQTLAFYNAIANNGELIRPRFIREVREFDKTIKKIDKEVISKKLFSDKTLNELTPYRAI